MIIYLGNNVNAHFDARHIEIFTNKVSSPQSIFLDHAAATELAEVIRRFLGRPYVAAEGKRERNDAGT